MKLSIIIGVIGMLLCINLIYFIPAEIDGVIIQQIETDVGPKTEYIDDIPGEMVLYNIANISVPKGVKLSEAYFNLSGLPDSNGDYSSNLFVSINNQGFTVYSFQGSGYGSFGKQTLFSDNTNRKTISFQSQGTVDTVYMILPKQASVNSASLQISGSLLYTGLKNSIENNTNGIGEIHPGDIDGDGDNDIVAAGNNEVVWYNNTNGNGSSWIKHKIGPGLAGAAVVYIFDVDNDNDTDVVAASRSGNPAKGSIMYYRNMDGKGGVWENITVNGTNKPIYECYNIVVADMDNDGDGDIVATSRNTTAPTGPYWFKNNDGNGTDWQMNSISNSYIRNYGLEIMDVDDDGDNDTIVTNYWHRSVHWFENKNGAATSWSNAQLIAFFPTGSSYNLAKGDIDKDGDLDLAVACSDGIVWLDHPEDPTKPWNSYRVGYYSSFTHGDIAIGDFGIQQDPPDGNLDIAAVTYTTSNDVILYKNSGAPSGGIWDSHLINPNHVDAYSVKTADIDNSNYTNIIVGANSVSTTEDILWYNLNGSKPSNIVLDIGKDAINEWTYSSGEFDTTVTLNNLANTFNTLINSNPVYFTDFYGNEFVLIEFQISSGSAGMITLHNISIDYDYSAKVKGSSSMSLAQLLNYYNTGSGGGNTTFQIFVQSLTPGRLKINNINFIYNDYPKALPIGVHKLNEDTRNDKLINLSLYFTDDYLDSKDLTYEIGQTRTPPFIDVFINEFQSYYLGVDAKTGEDNNDWNGEIHVVVKAIDDKGLETKSEEFTIEIEPVNDKPTIHNELPDITLKEGEKSIEIDLDGGKYFVDNDSPEIYYDYLLDPMDEFEGEQLDISLDNETWTFYVKAIGDFYTPNNERIRLRIFCDDNESNVKQSTIYQDVFITVRNLDDDAPVWSKIDDIIMDEDTIKNDVINLNLFVTDIDNPKSDLKFSILNVTNDNIIVEIDSQTNLDISTKKDFFGRGTVELCVTDGTNIGTTTFEVIVENVNDPPEVDLLSPAHENTVYNNKVILKWTGYDADPGDENDITYTIFIDTISGTEPYLTGYKGNSLEITNLSDKKTYYWKVIPSDGKSEGKCISEKIPFKFFVDKSRLPHTVLVSPTNGLIVNKDYIDLNWNGYSAENDELYYNIYVSTNPFSYPFPESALRMTNVSIIEYRLKELEPGKTYFWTVFPFSSTGEGSCESGIWSFKYDPKITPYDIILETPPEINLEQGEKTIEQIRIKNAGANPEIVIPYISAGSAKFLIGLEGEGAEHYLAPGESINLILNISTEDLKAGEYKIQVIIYTKYSGSETETALIRLNVKDIESQPIEESSKLSSSILPVVVLIIALIVILLIFFYRRKRFKEKTEEKDEVAKLTKLTAVVETVGPQTIPTISTIPIEQKQQDQKHLPKVSYVYDKNHSAVNNQFFSEEYQYPQKPARVPQLSPGKPTTDNTQDTILQDGFSIKATQQTIEEKKSFDPSNVLLPDDVKSDIHGSTKPVDPEILKGKKDSEIK